MQARQLHSLRHSLTLRLGSRRLKPLARVLALALALATSGAQAAPVMAHDIRADDWYSAYLLDVTTPQPPGTLGVHFDSYGHAFLGDSGSVALTPGHSYQLQVFVQDLASRISGWAGRFVLDPGFQFSCNNSNTLFTNTNPACWKASAAMLVSVNPHPSPNDIWGPNAVPTLASEAYVEPTATPYAHGNYGVGPWGTLGSTDPLAGSTAQWIWESSNTTLPDAVPGQGNVHAWFTTRIEAVPEPGSLPLVGAGLVAAGMAVRKRRRGVAALPALPT